MKKIIDGRTCPSCPFCLHSMSYIFFATFSFIFHSINYVMLMIELLNIVRARVRV